VGRENSGGGETARLPRASSSDPSSRSLGPGGGQPAGHGRGGSGAPPSARRGITGYTPVLGGGDLGPRSVTAATPTTATGARTGGQVLLVLQRHSSLDLHASL
jgi:hypothetical protein